MWLRILFFALIALGLIYLLRRYALEGFINTQDAGPTATAPFRGFFNEPSKYLNFCLTNKPRGNNGPYPIYWWWKYNHHPLHNKLYQNCDQYRCRNQKLNGYTANKGFNLTQGVYDNPVKNLQKVSDLNFGHDCGYYENPIAFCNKYPEYELCPNHWVSKRHPVHESKACSLRTPLKWQKFDM